MNWKERLMQLRHLTEESEERMRRAAKEHEEHDKELEIDRKEVERVRNNILPQIKSMAQEFADATNGHLETEYNVREKDYRWENSYTGPMYDHFLIKYYNHYRKSRFGGQEQLGDIDIILYKHGDSILIYDFARKFVGSISVREFDRDKLADMLEEQYKRIFT